MLLTTIFETAIIAASLSLDAFTAGFAYGSDKIKIPALSVLIIDIICGAITGLSLFAGLLISPHLPERLTLVIAFAILFTIGIIKLLDGITKSVIRRNRNINKEIEISMFNFRLILKLYADPKAADFDSSKVISSGEAAALALSLSLDGAAVGFGAAMLSVSGWALFLWSLITNAAALIMGSFFGDKLAEKLPYNISWAGGLALIALAISKLF